LETPDIHSVLEVTTGTGRLTKHLRKYFPATTKLTASDLSPDMLEVAKARLNDSTIEYQVADVQQLPFADNSFDLVVCHYGLMFLPDKQKGFDEIIRVLKSGGRFVFATWDKTRNIPVMSIILEDLIIPFFKDEDTSRFRIPFSMYEPAKMIEFFEAAGFVNNGVFPIEFSGICPSPMHMVNGMLLKHPLGREITSKDPNALMPIAEELERRIANELGKKNFPIELHAWIGMGQK
jgi:SAM-dependent methyltransferase